MAVASLRSTSMETRFASRCRQARPGIRAALAVLLGSNFENDGARLLELCGGQLDRMPALLTQAGCELFPADAHVVECLYSAITDQHGRIATKLSGHERAKRPELQILLDEDVRWRQGHKTRVVTSPQPAIRGVQVNTGVHIVGPSRCQLKKLPYCETHALGVPALGSPASCSRCAAVKAKLASPSPAWSASSPPAGGKRPESPAMQASGTLLAGIESFKAQTMPGSR